MIPRKFGQAVFALLLSGLMSLVVSGISTYRAVGWVPDYVGLWTAAWLTAWTFAFPVVVIAAPLVRRFTEQLLANQAALSAHPHSGVIAGPARCMPMAVESEEQPCVNGSSPHSARSG